MRRRALAGILGTAVVVIGAVGVLVVRAVSGGTPPDLGPGVVVPAEARTTEKPTQSGAPVVPVTPRDAGDHDDDADDGVTQPPNPSKPADPATTRRQTSVPTTTDDADDVGESDDGDD